MLLGAESSVRICATILPAGAKHVFDVYMHHPIAGRLQLVQPVGGNSAVLLSQYLMYSNGERKETRHKWQLVETSHITGKHAELDSAERFRQESSACGNMHGTVLISNRYLVWCLQKFIKKFIK